MKTSAIIALLLLALTHVSGQTVPDAQIQIKVAVMACPADQRDKATVHGYSPEGEWIVLRQGENAMVSLADDPAQKGLSVSCYHKDLEPFMSRGRALKKEGKNNNEITALREQEVQEGKLKMPESPSSLFVFTAAEEDYKAETGEVNNGYLRYVIYIPYATAESTGLPLKPEAPGMPWIMDPGTHKAHIMINPPKK